MTTKTRTAAYVATTCALALASSLAIGQPPQVQPLRIDAQPPALIGEVPQPVPPGDPASVALPPAATTEQIQPYAPPGNAAPMLGDVDLGETLVEKEGGNAGSSPSPGRVGTAQRAALAAQQSGQTPPTGATSTGNAGKPRLNNDRRAADRSGVERAVFDRHPVRVALPVERERLITLPGPAALHVPHDLDAVARIEAIDRTIYVTALVPFAPIRIVAELIDGGQQIPLDLVAGPQAAQASAELEVFVARTRNDEPALSAAGSAPADSAPPAADMVELTRFASRMLYAPARLATAQPGIQQVQVGQQPVSGLLRGARVLAVPMGQWRSAGLYVTAVRLTNQSALPLELQLEQLRGRWLAATAQHGRLGAAGSQTDTTAVYLICERAFESCL